jgi:hypothetical protein
MRQRSLFWPFILIATGITWLLVQLRSIPVENLWALMYIWPFFLLVAGIGLILRSRWPVVRGFVSALLVLGMFLAILFAPQLSWNRAPAWGSFHFGDWGNFNGSVQGSGEFVSQERVVADFNSIEVNYPAEITIQQGDATSLTVEGETNFLPQLETRVTGGTLYINNNEPDWSRRVNPTSLVKINITLKDLQKIDFPTAGSLQVENFQADRLDVFISGAGTINLSDLTAHKLTVNLSGAGSITASGTVDNLETDISGVGSFQGGNLASQTARINLSGAGSATAWVKNSLDVDISGVGSVSYYGTPTVQRNISGLGSVNSLGNR